MRIVEELDAGAILLQRATAIGERETAPELMERLSLAGAELLSETLRRIDEIEPREQEKEKATFAPVLRREDGLIEWALDASAIERRVRGFQPWPNAHTTYNSQRLVIWRASVADDERAVSVEGEIIRAHGDELVVSCGEGTQLSLHEVQPEGKRRMVVRDFLNGTRVRAGERLG
jgi:methionyl-tRNA formyltransferase